MSGDTLTLRAVTAENTAVYQCNVSNEFGYLLANAFVNVLRKLPIPLSNAIKSVKHLYKY